MSYKWVKKWKVKSSSGHGTHTVSLSVDGVWGCSCLGWTRNRSICRHIRDQKRQLNWDDKTQNEKITHYMELQAIRVQQLRDKGKTEAEIEKDLATIIANTDWGE